MKIKAAICDLDGTLCDTRHRSHFVQGRKNWNAFFSAAHKDPIVLWCYDLMKELESQGVTILFVTGRHEGLCKDTILWIEANTHFKVELNKNLFMRPQGDRREDVIVKKEIYEKVLSPQYHIVLAVDDKPSIINLWKSYKIPTRLATGRS